MKYTESLDETKVGEYPSRAKVYGGYGWDEVLEYRLWCRPERGAPVIENGNYYYYVYKHYPDALEFSLRNKGAEDPIALFL